MANQANAGGSPGLAPLVDDLATALVLGSGNWPTAAEALEAAAAAAGLERLASAVSGLRERLAGAGEGTPQFTEASRAGVQELHDLLESREKPPAAPASLASDPEVLSDFLMESREYLQGIEQNVLALEQKPGASEPIHSIFRAFHTIKGLAGFLEFQEIREVAHETETLLDRARNGALQMTPPVVDAVLASADYIGAEIKRISEGGATAAPFGGLLEKLRAVAETQLAGEEAPEAAAQAVADSGPAPQEPEPERAEAEAAAPAAKNAAPREAARDADDSLVRVRTSKLDYLIDMVGEMVIAQSIVRHSQDRAGAENSALQRNLAQLSRITNEVQKTAMSMRMVPIGMLFRKMARLIRDLSRKSGKPAELFTTGEDTELDRTIVEQLADPLMHMLRNAMDHGVEPPDMRAASGKPAVARIELRAFHQAGHIVIEIADDGRGLDRGGILKKAQSKGIVGAADHLSDAEIYNLIFEPGFSTAEKVTDIAGRGVGMDVVRRHIQKLRGRTEISTEPGKGSIFRLKLPLTLAIIDGLIVGVGVDRYIIPMFAVREILQPSEGMISAAEGRHEFAMIRERPLPVRRLAQIFHLAPRSENAMENLLIVIESQAGEYCLMVDAVMGKQEVVIKSLSEALKNVPGIAGGAILGDGRVGLILETNALCGASVHA